MKTIYMIKGKDSYNKQLIISVLVLFAIMIFVLNKLNNNIPTTIPVNTTLIKKQPLDKKLVYIVSDKASKDLYVGNTNSASYEDKLENFAKFLNSMGHPTKMIDTKELLTLGKDSVVFLIDTPALSNDSKNILKSYLKNGGNLFFNFIDGFSNKNGKYIGDGFVNSITTLKLSPKLGFIKLNKGEGLFITQRLISPINLKDTQGELLDISLYDELPIFETPKNLRADIFLSSYNQALPPTSIKQKSIKNSDSGALWHNYYQKGKWVYTSLPSYSFYDVPKSKKEQYKNIIEGAINFLSSEVITQKYPFIDKKAVVFISEDTEYKYENFAKFAHLASKYKIPVTAFIVSGIATKDEKNILLTKKIAKNPYVEFGSHSATHKKIVGMPKDFIYNETVGSKKVLDKFSKTPIIGFRPPREELDATMKRDLTAGGFAYVLGASQEYLYPRFDKDAPKLLYIPRHGTDDYSYLVNLDWSQKEIVSNMIREVNYVYKDLDAIFTLSVHTHLFSYGTNINIIEEFYKYLKLHPEFSVLDGADLTRRIILSKNISQSSNTKNNTVVIKLKNNNPVEINKLHIKVFKNPSKKIISVKSDNPKLFITVKNSKSYIVVNKLPAKSSVTITLTLGTK